MIQGLCEEIEKSTSEEDLDSILTKTNDNVASKQTNPHKKKQIPLTEHTLMRKVFLRTNKETAEMDYDNLPLAAIETSNSKSTSNNASKNHCCISC